MDRFRGYDKKVEALTEAVTFVITPLDVGTEAVRPGSMAELESRHKLLLLAAKLALKHIREGKVAIGAPFEFALETAIKMSERQL